MVFSKEDHIHGYVMSGLRSIFVEKEKLDFLAEYGFVGKNRVSPLHGIGYHFDNTSLANVIVLNQERCRITLDHLNKLKQWKGLLATLNAQQIETFLNDQGFFSE